MLPSDITATADVAELAAVVNEHPDYLVLKRFVPREGYAIEPWNLGEPVDVRLGVFVDCETTGLDRDDDQVIEFAAVPFTYNRETGVVYEVRAKDAISCFNEPTMPIPAETTEKHGITMEMVKGHRLPREAINTLILEAGIVVAHYAEFDRPILERTLPVFANVHWACSMREVPWDRFGVTGAKLQHILIDACGEFYDAHRALADCYAGVHVLAAAQLEGRTALSYLLESARKPTVRVWAIDSPFPKKEKLKTYRPRFNWSDGTVLPHKGWYCDVKPDAVDPLVEKLILEIYQARKRVDEVIITEQFGSRVRYSMRVGRK